MKKIVEKSGNADSIAKGRIKEAEDAVYSIAENSDGQKKEALIRAAMDLEKAEAELEESEEL